MVESLSLKQTEKRARYAELIPQIVALVQDEHDAIANQANCVAALKEAFAYFWVGFYRVSDGELLLGPFQGPIACTRIALGKGVCGTSWQEARTIVVDDVEQFPGHIACSSLSKSEIVIPVFDQQKRVKAVLDIDSDQRNSFDEVDKINLEELIQTIADNI